MASQNIKSNINIALLGSTKSGKSSLVTRIKLLLLLNNDILSPEFYTKEYIIAKRQKACRKIHLVDQTITLDYTLNKIKLKNIDLTFIDLPSILNKNFYRGLGISDTGLVCIPITETIETINLPNSILLNQCIAAYSFGIRRLIIAVTYMDIYNWSNNEYNNIIIPEMIKLLNKIGFTSNNVSFVPISNIDMVGYLSITDDDKILTSIPEELELLVKFKNLLNDKLNSSHLTKFNSSSSNNSDSPSLSSGILSAVASLVNTFSSQSVSSVSTQFLSLFSLLNSLKLKPVASNIFRFVVERVYHLPNNSLGIAGKVVSGSIAVGNGFKAFNTDFESTILEIHNNRESVEFAYTNENVTLKVNYPDYNKSVNRREVLMSVPEYNEFRSTVENHAPDVTNRLVIDYIEAQIVICSKQNGKIFKPNWTPNMSIHSVTLPTQLMKIISTVDKVSSEVLLESPASLNCGDSAIVHLMPCAFDTLFCESYKKNPIFGRFVLHDAQSLVDAVGVIKDIKWRIEPSGTKSRAHCTYNNYKHSALRDPTVKVRANNHVYNNWDAAPLPVAIVALSPEAIELAKRYEIDDFVDIRLSGGRWHAAQIVNKENVLFFLQIMDGVRAGEDILDFNMPIHRMRIAPLGSFTGGPKLNFEPDCQVDIKLTPSAMFGSGCSDTDYNTWTTGSVMCVDGEQVQVFVTRIGCDAWFHSSLKEIKAIETKPVFTATVIPLTSFGIELESEICLKDLKPVADAMIISSIYDSKSCSASTFSLVTFRSFPFHLAKCQFNVTEAKKLYSNFRNEVQRLIKFRHPNLIRILSLCVEEKLPPVPAEEKKEVVISVKSRVSYLNKQVVSKIPPKDDKYKKSPRIEPKVEETNAHELSLLTEHVSIGKLSQQLYEDFNPFLVNTDHNLESMPKITPNITRLSSTSGTFSLRARMSVSIGVCSALRYLHSQNISHLDLRSSTIHLEGFEPKLSPLELFNSFSEIYPKCRNLKECPRKFAWMAPELLLKAHNKTEDKINSSEYLKADVWSFGCLMLELFGGCHSIGDDSLENNLKNIPLSTRVPWFGQDELEINEKCVVEHLPPPQLNSSNLPSNLKSLLEKCFAWDPSDRPTIIEVQACLLFLVKLSTQYKPRDLMFFARYVAEASTVSNNKCAELMNLDLQAFENSDLNTSLSSTASNNLDYDECVICLDADPTHKCLPCDHKCICAGCAMKLSSTPNMTCPFCRGSVDKIEKSN